MHIRAGKPEEAVILTDLALRSKAHWGYDEEFMAACRDELTVRASEVERRRTTVAERDGRVVGFTTLEGEPPEGVLGMIFVEPDAIGQSIGRLLFEHTVDTGRRLGITRHLLEVALTVASAEADSP